MPRLLLALLLAASTGAASAAQCYAFWVTECFELRDALRRDLTHHVVLSLDSPHLFEAAPGQCAATLDRLLGEAGRREVLRRFNRVLGKIRGCALLEALEPVVLEDGAEAYRRYRELERETPIGRVHRVGRLPLP